MARFVRVVALLFTAIAVPVMLSGCTSSTFRSAAAPTCSQLLDAAIQSGRSGTGDIDVTLDSLSGRCSDEYEIAIDYLSNAAATDFRIDSCDELLGYGVRSESVALLEEDGWCTFGSAQQPAVDEWPDGGLGWDDARTHAGTVQRVCGPLMSVRNTDDGAFVNVGRDYPSTDRFTFVFWEMYLDHIETGAVICGTGEIYLYEGTIAQVEMWDPGTLEIWR